MNPKCNVFKLAKAIGTQGINKKALLIKLRIKSDTLKKYVIEFNKEINEFFIGHKKGKYHLIKRFRKDISIGKPRTDEKTKKIINAVAETEPIQGLFESIPEEWKISKLLDDIRHNRDSLSLDEKIVVVLREYVKIKRQVKDVLNQIDNSLVL